MVEHGMINHSAAKWFNLVVNHSKTNNHSCSMAVLAIVMLDAGE